jgi:dihydropteroate synthase
MHATDARTLTFTQPVPGALKTCTKYVFSWRGVALMGILNVTPDSFSDSGHHLTAEAALAQAATLIREGATVLDVGGESTRPGAEPVAADTELDRILPVLRGLRGADVLVSVDTYKPEVAASALRSGAHLVNDVSGLRNPEMVRVCAEAGAPAVIMHMQGTPQTMQLAPSYQDVWGEVSDTLQTAAEEALAAGIPAVMLDPGIGFGKTSAHNLTLLRRLDELVSLGYPVLLGASRKGLIRELAGESVAAERDPGTLALHLWGAQQGVAMVRAHNVAAHAQALKVWEALRG